MSLVREALAKAEREAAARAAREKGLPPALADAAQPFRAPRRPRWPWAAALVAATLAGAALASFLLSVRDPRAGVASAEPAPAAERSNHDRIPAREPARNTEAPSRAQEPVPTGGRGAAEDGIASAGSPPPTETPAASAPGAEHANRERIPAKETAPSTEAPSLAQEPSPSGARGISTPPDPGAGSPPGAESELATAAAAQTGALAGSYVRDFAVEGGRKIHLGGIAWSEAAPLAYLNGRLRVVGEVVEGWRIAAIERDRVILENGRLRIGLRLR